MSNDRIENFSQLAGKVLTEVDGATKGSGTIFITLADGRKFRLYHDQDCCESVEVEDVCGDVADLIGSPLTVAEEVSNAPAPEGGTSSDECTEWTFYKLATIRGSVTIRWLGESNGYYGTSVSFGPAA